MHADRRIAMGNTLVIASTTMARLGQGVCMTVAGGHAIIVIECIRVQGDLRVSAEQCHPEDLTAMG